MSMVTPLLVMAHDCRADSISSPTWPSGATPTASCSNDPEQRHRHALEFMATAVIGDKQPGDLALHARGDHDRARVGQRLYSRGDIRHTAENLAGRIDNRRTRVEAYTGGKLRLASIRILAVNSASARARPRSDRSHPRYTLQRVSLLRRNNEYHIALRLAGDS
jgi:hypothetical protein